MEYEIVITKREPNPKYEPRRTNYGPEEPMYLEQRVLSTVVTVEEFQAIKKACLEVM